jgi:hypothetical protein
MIKKYKDIYNIRVTNIDNLASEENLAIACHR